ncbi:MAG: hypothetical protein ACRDOA_14425 [Streptosporangiaceae bacterium]
MDSNVSAWTFGGSILTMAFPMILFIVVAIALYVLYTKPEFVPGHWVHGAERPVSYTALPGKPAIDHVIPAAPAGAASPTRAEMAGPAPAETTGTAEAPGNAAHEITGTEDAE